MKKTCFVCPKCEAVEIDKIASRDSILLEKNCKECKIPMNCIRQNKKKWKDKLKKQKLV